MSQFPDFTPLQYKVYDIYLGVYTAKDLKPSNDLIIWGLNKLLFEDKCWGDFMSGESGPICLMEGMTSNIEEAFVKFEYHARGI